ncbi:MAG: phosphate ABC transporter substrate-binding protein [Rhodocyclaceae bacterium]|jgi:hypothetical protein|nr:phosphate ABC transporter substrate-binding protein [Rhodocyclaceae bacterium]
MSLKLLFRVLAALFGWLCLSAHAAEVFVICNSGVQIAAPEIKEVFTGDKQFAGTLKLNPVDNGPLQAAFLSAVLKLDTLRYNMIWTKKSFREGINPPPVKSGDSDVLDFVRKTPGAIGYVSSAPSGVTVIQKF